MVSILGSNPSNNVPLLPSVDAPLPFAGAPTLLSLLGRPLLVTKIPINMTIIPIEKPNNAILIVFFIGCALSSLLLGVNLSAHTDSTSLPAFPGVKCHMKLSPPVPLGHPPPVVEESDRSKNEVLVVKSLPCSNAPKYSSASLMAGDVGLLPLGDPLGVLLLMLEIPLAAFKSCTNENKLDGGVISL